MHRTTALLLILAFVAPLATAQGSGPVTIEPAAPRVGETVTVTYDPAAPGATLSADEDALEVAYEVLERPSPSSFVQPTYRAVPMERSGGLWRARVPYTDGALGVQFAVQGDTLADHNGHRFWSAVYHGDDGDPVRGARHAQVVARVTVAAMAQQMEALMSSAGAFVDATAADPSDVRSIAAAAVFTQQPSRDSAVAAVAAFEADRADDVKALREAHDAYARLVANADAARLRSRLVELDPSGPEARDLALEAWRAEPDPERQRALLLDLDERFPGAAPYADLLAAHADDPARLMDIARRYVEDDPADPSGAHAAAALALADADLALDLPDRALAEAALAYARRAVRLADDQWRTARFRGLLTPAARRAGASATRGRAETALGQALVANGAMADAELAFERGVTYAFDDPATWVRLAAFREVAADAESAAVAREGVLGAYRRALVADPASVEARDGFERAYTRAHGSADGYDRAYAEALAEAFADVRVDEPVESFSFVDLDGRPLTSEDVSGAVVLLDFWATWCVPCIEGFPVIQDLHDRYADDPSVRVLTVHSSGRETADDARAFAEGAPYTFPYLVDEGGAYLESIGFEGLPTKVLLDSRGRIQFRSSGTTNDSDRAVAVLKAQIDLLRAEARAEAGGGGASTD